MELHLKYRPERFENVRGQREICDSLIKVLAGGTSRAFLLTGPSGVGKTTIARIIARNLGVDDFNLIEQDAATRTGVDDVRKLIELVSVRPMGGNGNRVIVMDECHMMSKSAWASLLKTIEEPPTGCTWVFCTTEPGKVPKNIRTRCTQYDLKPVGGDDIMAMLLDVCDAEDYVTPDDIIELVADHADGSPRTALVALAAVSHCTDVGDASAILGRIEEGDPAIIDLCRALMKGTYYAQALGILCDAGKVNPEGSRIQICAYFTKVALGGNTDALAILEAFGTPYPPTTSTYPLILSLGNLLL